MGYMKGLLRKKKPYYTEHQLLEADIYRFKKEDIENVA